MKLTVALMLFISTNLFAHEHSYPLDNKKNDKRMIHHCLAQKEVIESDNNSIQSREKFFSSKFISQH